MNQYLLPLIVLSGIGWQVKAIAHGVAIEYQSTQAYEIRAVYDSGEPMAEVQVAVFAPSNPTEPWLQGTTDREGRFLFTPDAPGNWEVQIRQAGHGDIVTIPVSNSVGAAPKASAATANSATANPSPDTVATPSNAIATSNSYSPLQKGLMMGSVIWGCLGTALFFSRGKK
jgi:nickel transport protein